MRPTIYWNGDIKPDATGKANLFFILDAKNNYTLVLEGVTTRERSFMKRRPSTGIIRIEGVFHPSPFTSYCKVN
jgi:hypothetical protein